MSSDNPKIVIITRMPIEDGFVYNPVSGRKISTKSRTFKTLLNKQILKLDTSDKNIVIYEGNNAVDVDKKLNIVDDKHTTMVKNNKIFKRRKNVNKSDIQEKVQDISLIVYKENAHLFTENMPQKEVQKILKNLINQKLINNNSPNTTMSESDRKIKSSFEYIVDNIPDEDEDDGDEDDEDDDDEDEDN
jgi:hypothetical protein